MPAGSGRPFDPVLYGRDRLWSSRAMGDFTLKHFDTVMWLIRHEEERYSNWALKPPPPDGGGLFGLGSTAQNALAPSPSLVRGEAPSQYKDDQRRTLTFAERLCKDLELEGGLDRVALGREYLDGAFVEYKGCHAMWQALREQIEKEIERRHIFYIRKDAAAPIFAATKDWGSVFAGFPTVKQDVLCALRCFAYEQHTASVFHLMRVAEVGLRAVAKERRMRLARDKPIDAAQWADLTTRLNTVVETINNWKAKDAKKQPALAFYTAVRADTVFFKDRYRNIVSHSLAHFDEPDAESVSRRVREFMILVASRLDESAKPIRWTK